jgi:uncharacterized protein (TIGR02285 family)
MTLIAERPPAPGRYSVASGRRRRDVMLIRKILFAVWMGMASAAAEAGDHITWLHPEFPPSYIVSGEFAGQGYLDQQLAVLQAKMPGFTHSVVSAPLKRIWHELPRVDGYCFLGASITEERLKLALFSKRGIDTPIIQLAMRAEEVERIRPYLNANGEVDLDRLKFAPGLEGAYTDTASYGSLIDKFIHAQDRTVVLTGVVEMRHPFTLLQNGRTGFIFVWPEQLTYFKRSTHSELATASYRIAGTSDAQPYYVACSKGLMGQKAITRINAILAEPAAWHEFVAPLKTWFPPVDFDRVDSKTE